MKNKILKIIYNLRQNKNYTLKQIKSYIKKYYNISLTLEYIKIYSGIKIKNQKYCELELNKILYLYQNVQNTDKLILYLNKKYDYKLTDAAIRTITSRNSINKINKKPTCIRTISKDDMVKIKNMYLAREPIDIIAKTFGYKTRNSVYQILEEIGVNRRSLQENCELNKKYDIDMEKIDSEFKAYFLGLMYTDGYVYHNERNYRYYVQLSLTDLDVMKFIQSKIKCNIFEVKKKNKNCKKMYRLQLHGEKLVKQFEKHGCVQKKSNILNPILNDEELKYFNYILRGAIDGDGWINKNGHEFFLCSASYKFLDFIKVNMEKIGFTNLKVKEKIDIKNNIKYKVFVLRTGLKHNIDLLKELIYDKPYGMNRKYNRIYQIKERPSETIIRTSDNVVSDGGIVQTTTVLA